MKGYLRIIIFLLTFGIFLYAFSAQQEERRAFGQGNTVQVVLPVEKDIFVSTATNYGNRWFIPAASYIDPTVPAVFYNSSGYIDFDFRSIPTEAVIESASLNLYQYGSNRRFASDPPITLNIYSTDVNWDNSTVYPGSPILTHLGSGVTSTYNSNIVARKVTIPLQHLLLQGQRNESEALKLTADLGIVFCASDNLPFGPCNENTRPQLNIEYRVNQPPYVTNLVKPLNNELLSYGLTPNECRLGDSICTIQFNFSVSDDLEDYPLLAFLKMRNLENGAIIEKEFMIETPTSNILHNEALSSGEWEWGAYAIDRHGVASTFNFEKRFRIDLAMPESPLLSILPIVSEESSKAKITNFDANLEYQVVVLDAVGNKVYESPWASNEFIQLHNLIDGESYTVYAIARSQSQNVSGQSVSTAFATDFTAPMIDRYSLNRFYVKDLNVLSVEYSVSDLNFKGVKLKLVTEGGLEIVNSGYSEQTLKSNFADLFPEANLSSGSYKLELQVSDLAGNVAIAEKSFIYDIEGGGFVPAPIIESISLVETDRIANYVDGVYYGNSRTLLISGIAKPHSAIEGNSPSHNLQSSVDNEGRFTISVELDSALPEDLYEIKIWSENEFDTRSNETITNYVLDTTAPFVEGNSGTLSQSNKILEFLFTTNERLQNIESESKFTWKSYEGLTTLQLLQNFSEEGLYQQLFEFEDFAGNFTQKMIEITIDNTPPAAPFVHPKVLNELFQISDISLSRFHGAYVINQFSNSLCITASEIPNQLIFNFNSIAFRLLADESCSYFTEFRFKENVRSYLSVKITDFAGNESPPSNELAIIFDSNPPAAPKILSGNYIRFGGVNIVNENSLKLDILVEPFSTLYLNGQFYSRNLGSGAEVLTMNNLNETELLTFESYDEVGNKSEVTSFEYFRNYNFHGGLLNNPYLNKHGFEQSADISLELLPNKGITVLQQNISRPDLTALFNDQNKVVELYGVGFSPLSRIKVQARERFYNYARAMELCDLKSDLSLLFEKNRSCIEKNMGVEDILKWRQKIYLQCAISKSCYEYAKATSSVTEFKSVQVTNLKALLEVFNGDTQFGAYQKLDHRQEYDLNGRVLARLPMADHGLKQGEWIGINSALEFSFNFKGAKYEIKKDRAIKSSISTVHQINGSEIMEKDGERMFVNNVPYFNQFLEPSGTSLPKDGWQMCGAATVVMATAFYEKYPEKDQNEHDYKKYMYSDSGQGIPGLSCGVNKGGAFEVTNYQCNSNSIWGMNNYLQRFGYKATPIDLANPIAVSEALNNGELIMTGYTNDGANGIYFGHFALVVGYTDRNNLVLHDPFTNTELNGIAWKGYEDGKYAIYPSSNWKFRYVYSYKISKI